MENITKLGIGTIGLKGVYGKINLTEYSFAIRYALNAGISLVDTASSYGDAEKLVGIILKDYPHVQVCSRLESMKLTQEKNLKKAIKRVCEESLNNLERESIDFYNCEISNLNRPLEEVIEGLNLLKKEGKIKHYGIGNMREKDMKGMMNEGDPTSILFEYSAIQRQNAERIFGACEEHKLIKIAYGIMGRGYLGKSIKDLAYLDDQDTRRTLELFDRHHEERNKEVLHAISAIAKQKGLTSAQVAIAWVLSDPRLDYGIMSTSKYLHVIENIQGAQIVLDDDELEYLDTTTFYAEKKLMENEMNRIHHILLRAIVSPEDGRRELLEVINIAISRQMVEEERLLPTLFDLYTYDQNRHTVSYLNRIREQLKEVIKIEDAS